MADMGRIPILEMELRYIAHSVKTALMVHEDTIKEGIGEAVEHAIKNFDFEGRIETVAEGIINETIERRIKVAVEDMLEIELGHIIRQKVNEAANKTLKEVKL